MRCYKCDSHTVWIIGDERMCLVCGWADAEYNPPRKTYRGKGIEYWVNYNGSDSAYEDLDVNVKVKNAPTNKNASIMYEVTWPHDDTLMWETSRAKNKKIKIKKSDIIRYKCKQKHTIILTGRNDGTLLWQ